MKKRTKICLYIFLVCSFLALGILGYFVFNPSGNNVRAGSRKFVTFNSVDAASSYSIQAGKSDSERSGETLTYKVGKTYDENMHETHFRVEVFSGEDALAVETYTQSVIKENGNNKIDCKISGYTISFFSSGETLSFPDQMLTNVDKDIFCSVVSEFMPTLFTSDGSYTIYLKAFDESGEEIEHTCAYTFYYRADTEEEFLRRGEYYYDGQWLDYVIESQDELDMLVWWAVLYRQQNLSFFIKTDDINEWNINSLVISAINDYPEYDALEEVAVYAIAEGNVGILSGFSYYLDENFTLVYTDLKEMDTSANKDYYNIAITQLHQRDNSYNQGYFSSGESEERHFPLDNCENEVLVYNTEQLFMVVQSGAKPLFESGKSDIAQSVYLTARDILSSINNSDNLSDYDKMLNIYRYITGEVVYDYVIYSYMQLRNDYSIRSFGNFSCFYLEGVFYDFGLGTHYAVCDGLSKAFCLMCKIEGIDCIKVNGSVGGGNHAWNRVCIKDEGKGLDGNYFVDTTWGEGTYNREGENYQFLTHMYFLFDGDLETRSIFYPQNVDTAPEKAFDYYQHTFYNDKNGNQHDMYVESDDELENILSSHAQNLENGDTCILEFKLSAQYASEKDSKMKQLRDITKNIKNASDNVDYLTRRIEDLKEKILRLKMLGGWNFALQTHETELSQAQTLLDTYTNKYDSLTQERDEWLDNMGIDCGWEWIDLGSIVMFKLMK